MRILTLLFVDTNTKSPESFLLSSFLSDENIKELSRYKLEETKKEKAVSMILKNKFIGEYYLNESGKPLSKSCYFNISHSKGYVVFIKDDVPVGVDIEKIRPVEDDLIDYISSREEKKYITTDQKFYVIWTNKESLTKCLGTGIKEKIKDIPSIPINDIKTYKNKTYRSQTVKYKDSVISVTRESTEPFEIKIQEENL